MKKKVQEITNEEIIAKLKWFHGSDFDKYPLSEELLEVLKRIA